MYNIALYSTIDYKKKVYNLTRLELNIVNDLMEIKKKFVCDSQAHLKFVNSPD